jgi:AraC family transcriptional regulator
VERVLFESATFVVGEFTCPPGDTRWSELNAVSEAAHVVFPRTSVVIHQAGRDAVLANRNHVVFYSPAQRFRRALHDRRGDISTFIEILPSDGFSFGHAPVDARTYLLQDVLVRSLRQQACDALCVEEVLANVVQRSLESGMTFHQGRARRPRRSAESERARLVESTKEKLTADPAGRATLTELARSLHTSPFHLARVFRERTGFSIHGYRTQLRLRLALDRLDKERDLTALALALGFASHSHFTTAFRSSFGVPPSAARSRGVAELRTILEARLQQRA